MQKSKYVSIFITACVLMLASTSCLDPEIPDVSGLTAEEPATSTPEPTPTNFSIQLGLEELTSAPSDRPRNDGPGSNASPGISSESNRPADPLSSEISSVVQQIEKLKVLVNDIKNIDGSTKSRMEQSVNSALSEASGNDTTAEKAQALYESTKNDLNQLASNGAVDPEVNKQFSEAGSAMVSTAAKGLADAMSNGRYDDMSSQVEALMQSVPQLAQAEYEALADDLVRAAAGLEEIDPDLFATLMQAASALRSGVGVEDILETLESLKIVLDEVTRQFDFEHLIKQGTEEIEQEARSMSQIQSLVAGSEGTGVTEIDVDPFRLPLQSGISADILPEIKTSEASSGAVCGLSFAEDDELIRRNGTLLCFDSEGTWSAPTLTEDPTITLSGIETCKESFVISTNKLLIRFDMESIAEWGTHTSYPFKPPTVIDCNYRQGLQLWALPSSNIADNPWFFYGDEWKIEPHILQNSLAAGRSDSLWGIKWEVSDNSPTRDGNRIDLIPYISQLKNGRWSIFYSSDWEEGLFGVGVGPTDEVWFVGPTLYRLSQSGEWQAYSGYAGSVFTVLPNNHLLAGKIDGSGLVYFNGSSWHELTDWPADLTPKSITYDTTNRIWIGVEGGLIMWDGSEWRQFERDQAGAIQALAVLGSGPRIP